MDSSTPALLKLRVENRKRNVFVTQLEEHREQIDEQTKHIPVITESSSGVLLTGVQTLQSTLVLQKRGEVEALEEQLKETRQEVQENMRVLQRRRAQLQQRQSETKQRAAKFEKFVEENEVKRRRALKKFQIERQQKEVKQKEKEELSIQLQDLQARRLYLQERVNKYKKYEEFLLKTLDLLPDKYLGFGTDLVTPIIRRYETLSFSRQDLLEKLSQLMEKMKTSQSHLEASRQQHSTFRLMMNQELSERQTQLDQLKEKNKQLEMTLHLHLGQSRDQVEELGSILIAVKSLAEQCHLSHYGALDLMDTRTMMDMIKEFITEKADLERRAMRLMDSSAATVKRSTPKKKTLQTHTSRASN
ncbi:coiled-coil domain-containing protein 42 homolog isoform X2 [Puntigrus tetrazona]|uniref:coiled-coil domain-containing protein 42 homolog isoform X2 n=1 Tax=Puntigrus tetrazona TaxID=1606681 RepID=UPI001C8A2732|nr:coiled-coil domain-containing protein 42 homolog isoform X2 [Puntigrus tetrazona]